jgi:hypothetical protein
MYDQICAFDNLYAAFRAARRGKRAQPAVAAFEFNLENELLELRQQLLSHTFRPGPYHSFWIHDPKRRLISAAPFRDRVVHHAVCQIIEPIFERRFIGDSYANRVGKGTHRALDRCTQFLRRFKYGMPLDVVQYFPSVDHALLRRLLARAIRDAETMDLIDVILHSGAGVLADAYDVVWFPGDDLLAAVRLTVHQVQAQPRPVTEGIPFLGFHAYPDHRRLKQRRVVYAWRRLKALRDQVQLRALPLAAFEAALSSWQAHAAHGDTWRLRCALLSDVVIRYAHV